MIGFAIALAILNVAVIAACWLLVRVWFVNPPPVGKVGESQHVVDQTASDKPRLDLPAAWGKQLSRAHIAVHSVIEGGVHIVEMDLDRYEAELHDVVDLVQVAVGSSDDLELAAQATRLQTLMEQRMPELESTSEELGNRKDEDTQLRRFANQLAEALTDELAEMSDASHKVSQLNFARDASQAGEQLSAELERLLELAGELRSLTDDLLKEVRTVTRELSDEKLDLQNAGRFAKLQQEDSAGVMQTSVVDAS